MIEEMDSSLGFAGTQIGSSVDHRSAGWRDVTSLRMRTNGGRVKFTVDTSVYGIQHGGIRVVMDNHKVFGKQGTYGLDWLIAETNNRWQKRNLQRIVGGVPAGTHTFKLQIRSQANGRRVYLHSGSVSQQYSGVHFIAQELPRNHFAVQCNSHYDHRSARWVTIGRDCGRRSWRTTGKDIAVQLDFSVYGVHHGGMRICIDRCRKKIGSNSGYGMDWVIPQENNRWYKRTITRVFKGLPAGRHTFEIQIRGQGGRRRFYIHGGSRSQSYSGLQWHMWEL